MSVMRAAVTVGSFTLLSRIVGFLRECLMVFCLGAGIYTDALLVALRLANTFRRIFAEGAFNSSFLPRFSRVLNKEGQENANIVLSDVFLALVIIISIFCAIVLFFFPSVLRIILSGFDELSEKFQLTVVLGRICFPYLLFISVASLFAGVLNTINKFALPAALYSLLSLFTMSALIIGYCLDLSHFTTVHVISVFVLLSGITQSIILFNSVKNNGFNIKLRLNFWSDKVKDILKNMIPGIIGAGVWQLNLLVDTTISSFLPVGTITCINLADRLNQFPLGTLGIALSTALLPVLSKNIASKDYATASKELERGLVFAFFLTFFATTLFMALSEPTVAVAFQRGLFGAEQVKMTADAVVGFAVGLPAYVLTKVFSSVYFAFGDTKTPVIFGAISVVLNAIFLIIIVPFLKYFGLALCTSLSAISNALMFIYFCDERIKLSLNKGFLCNIVSQICGSIIMYVVLIELKKLYWLNEIGASTTKWIIYITFLSAGFCAFFVTTVVCLRLSGQHNWRLWHKKSWQL